MSDEKIGPVVSSAHLADGGFSEISEFEFGLITASNAFNRWVVRSMSAAGFPDLTYLEVLVLHTVRHRNRPKKMADICLTMNIEDTHTVSYALKKLTKANLVKATRAGKEKMVEITELGDEACARYKEVRDHLLLSSIDDLGFDKDQISKLSKLLRLMSGQYDQATRSAAVV